MDREERAATEDSPVRGIRTDNFGIFIHWGIYSIPAFNPVRKTKKTGTYNGSEWYLGRLLNTYIYGKQTVNFHQKTFGTAIDPKKRYFLFLNKFERMAADWNAESWLKLLGPKPKYIIITAKHHDGVCLYPSKYGTYHTRRDYISEIRTACRKYKISFGIYYSLMEWGDTRYSKGKKKIGKYVTEVLQPQLRELVERYEPDILWVDGHWPHTTETWRTIEFLDWLFEEFPDTIINDRWGNDFSDYMHRYSDRKIYKTGVDRLLAPTEDGGLWEHVNTIGNSWGFAKNQTQADYKTGKELANLYRQVTDKGGRFTLNLGPKPDGTFDEMEYSKYQEFINLI